MKSTLVFYLCLIGFVLAKHSAHHHHHHYHQTVANAPIGRIRGSILTSRHGRQIYSFRGIRYGKPPVGPLRFQPPVPAEDWEDVFDASKEGPSCPRPNNTLISEDCLRLNVYTTKLPCERENVSRPVMVFIHPGGFYSFSGQSEIFGPQYLMDKDVVLVTINYRLGTLGFLSTGDQIAPGNMGLKDQVVALRWIQRNIAAFGGNPNSVTLVGCSAGSFSIMLHMVSPMSKNLFHRAIGMSSSAIKPEVYSGISQNGQIELAKKQARLVGCPTDSTSAMVQCLNTLPMENFTNTLDQMFDWHGNPILLWTPTVEPNVPGLERFLSEQPYDMITQGRFYQVPYILGITEEEFGGVIVLYERGAKSGNNLYPEVNNNWTTLAPIICMYERDTPQSNYISNELRQFYFKDQQIDSSTKEQLAKVYGDSVIIFPMYRAAKLFATYSKEPVYFYKFTYEGRYSFYMWNDTTPYGASHQDDLMYLFYMEKYFPYFGLDAPEAPMIELYTSMWTNFATNSEPIPKNDDKFRNVKWNNFVPEQINYLDINLHPTMKTGIFPERMQLWERLFPLPSASKTVKQ